MTMKLQNENETTVMRMPQWTVAKGGARGGRRSIRTHKATTMSLLSQRPNQVRRSVSLPAELRTKEDEEEDMALVKRKLSLFSAPKGFPSESMFGELVIPCLDDVAAERERKMSATSRKRGRFGDVLQQLDPVALTEDDVVPAKVLEVQERRVQNRYRIPVCVAEHDDQDSDLYFDETEENLRGLEFVEEDENEYDSDDSSLFDDENESLGLFY